MSKPEAGTRNLEAILASIRQTLAHETVDGLVELTAAAAAAARAEAQAAAAAAATAVAKAQSAADDTAMFDKLAGALNGDGEAHVNGDDDSDFSDLLAEAKVPTLSIPKASAGPGESAAEDGASKDSLWFLRPGAPDERPQTPPPASAPFGGGGPSLEIPKPAAARSEPAMVEAPRAAPPKAAAAPAEVLTPTAPKISEPADVRLTRPEALRASFPPLFGGATDQRKPVVSPPTERPLSAPRLPDPVLPKREEPALRVQEPKLPEPAVAPPSADFSLADVLQEEPAAPAPAAPDGPASAKAADAPGAVFFKPAPAPVEAKAGPPVAPPFAEPKSPPPARPAVRPDAFARVSNGAGGGAAADLPPGPNGPLEDMIAALLEPVLQKLLDKNLKPIVEAVVREQVASALQAERNRARG